MTDSLEMKHFPVGDFIPTQEELNENEAFTLVLNDFMIEQNKSPSVIISSLLSLVLRYAMVSHNRYKKIIAQALRKSAYIIEENL